VSDTALHAARPAQALAPRVALLAWWLVAAGITAAGAAFALGKVVNHDVAYWIDAAGRLLDGAVLYRDLIELNPPTNYFVTLIPVALARAAGFDAVLAFHTFVLALALLAAVLSGHVLHRVLGDALPSQLMMLPLAIVFLVLPGNDFGQREHILAMLLLPYLLLTAAPATSAVSAAPRLSAGVMAGAVLAYKPYFILYLAVAEALRLWRVRKLTASVETIAALAVVAGAALVTLLAFPDYTRFIVPLGRALYHGFEAPLAAVLLQAHFLATLPVIAASLFLLRRLPAGTPAKPCVAVLLGGAIAALLIYVVQMKGWGYHVLPATMLAWAALGLLLVVRAARALRIGAAPVLALGLALAAAIVAAFQLQAAASRDDSIRAEIAPLIELLRREAKGAPALFLSTHLPYGFPVVNYAGATWPYRYHHLLPLPGLYHGYQPAPSRAFRAPDEMDPVEAQFFATMVEDALRFPPRVILVDQRRQFPPISELGFDFLAYFRQDARFDRLFASYRHAGQVSRQDVYIRGE
jgi:hypothetical protein